MTSPTRTPEQTVMSAFSHLTASRSPSLHRLRRGTSLLDAMMEGVFHETRQALHEQGCHWIPDDNLACALLLLPLVKPGAASLGTALADRGFSELRFRQLLAAESPDELFTALQRALRQLEGVSPFSVLDVVLRWTETGADTARKRLLADYFSVEAPEEESVRA